MKKGSIIALCIVILVIATSFVLNAQTYQANSSQISTWNKSEHVWTHYPYDNFDKVITVTEDRVIIKDSDTSCINSQVESYRVVKESPDHLVIKQRGRKKVLMFITEDLIILYGSSWKWVYYLD